jgi:hypothetical protein
MAAQQGDSKKMKQDDASKKMNPAHARNRPVA